MNTTVAARPGRKNFARQLALKALSCTMSRRRLMVQGDKRNGAVYLTFDDGPSPETTPRILDTLRAHGAKATFFVVGRQAAAHPEIVRRMLDEGHTVGGHTYHHSPPNQVDGRRLLEELRATDAELARIAADSSRTGSDGHSSIDSPCITSANACSATNEANPFVTKLFRPPYGKLSVAKFWRLWNDRRTIVLWNKDPKDFAAESTAQLLDWFQREPIVAGDIVLLHDTSSVTAKALDQLLTNLESTGLKFAPLG